MSTALAIAAVTAAIEGLLRQALQADIAGTAITTRPLDRARDTTHTNQLNLFLYHTEIDAAWRNRDVPWSTQPGERKQTPLSLTLHYLLTAYYGEEEDATDATSDANRLLGSHRLLGRALSVLHDHPLLDGDQINDSLSAQDQLNEPYRQVERVRLTWQPLTLDEMSKLWSGFQTNYRLSAAYAASVVLIESSRPARAALPVLTRGTHDRGVAVQADLAPPFATLLAVTPPDQQPSVRLGEMLTLAGQRLQGDEVVFRFEHRLLDEPHTLAPAGTATATSAALPIPNDAANWPAGFYTAAALVSTIAPPRQQASNRLPLTLAPEILTISPNPAARDAQGDVTLTVTCRPQVRPEQTVSLLLGDREVPAEPFAAQTNSVTFTVEDAAPGAHFIRLRVDGVDSLLVDRSVVPPVFDDSQQVTIT